MFCRRNCAVYGNIPVFPKSILWFRISHRQRSVFSDCFWRESAFRLDYYTKRLPYYILSVQPVRAREKRGKFSRLGFFLSKKLERSQNSEKI